MTANQLKNELAKLKEMLKPEVSQYHLIIYDSKRRKGEEINLDTIVKINGKDATGLSDTEKEEILCKSHIHFYLPEKL